MADAATLISELNDHGFEDTSTARKTSALNYAIQAISVLRPWPFMEKVWTLAFDGSSPVPTNTLTDLRAVRKLMDTTTGRRIRFMRTDDIEERYGSDLLSAGEPYFYYFEGSQLRVYKVPSASQALRLRGLRYAPTITDTSPESAIVIPAAYHEAIVFRALMRLYDLEDDPELSARFGGHFDKVLQEMTEAMLTQQYDEPEYVHVIDPDDYDFDM